MAEGRVRRVMPNGVIVTAAGMDLGGSSTCQGDPGQAVLPVRAIQARLPNVWDVAMGPDGTLYITSTGCNRVYKVTSDGWLDAFAGGGSGTPVEGQSGYAGDGVQATATGVWSPVGVAVARDGSVYIGQNPNAGIAHRVRRVGTDGVISTVLGVDGVPIVQGNNGPASKARVSQPQHLTFDAAGRLYLPDYDQTDTAGSPSIRRIEPPFPGFAVGTVFVASQDGSEIYAFDEKGRLIETIDRLRSKTKLTFTYSDAGLATIADAYTNVTTIVRDSQGKATAIQGPFGDMTSLQVDAAGWLTRIQDAAGNAHVLTPKPDGLGLLASYKTPNQDTFTYAYDPSTGRLLSDTEPASAGGVKTLVRTGAPTDDGWSVSLTTLLGRATSGAVARNDDGDIIRTATDPAGLRTTRTRDLGFEQTTADPTGMLTVVQPTGDDKLGFAATFEASLRITSPGGRDFKRTHTRVSTTQANADPTKPPILTTRNDTITETLLGPSLSRLTTVAWSHNAPASWDASLLGKLTTTTPELRALEEAIDADGRLVGVRLGSLHPLKVGYDSRGRVQTLKQGPGGAADRQTSFGYHPTTGRLATLTDAAARVTSFDLYDAAGRLTQMTLPGSRIVGFGYDANGNLTSLTPPGQPAHIFRYTAVDNESEYEPPALAGIPDPRTIYSYNVDRQLELVTRPDGTSVDPLYESASGRLDTITLRRNAVVEGVFDYVYEPIDAQGKGGRLSSIAGPEAETLSFAYDGVLPLSSTWGGVVIGSVSRTFRDDFRVATDTVAAGSTTSTVTYAYDKDGLVTAASVNGGPAYTIVRSSSHGLITGTTLASSSPVTTTETSNAFGDLAEETASFASAERYKNEYMLRDAVGRIQQKRETLLGQVTTYDYTYTPAGQLDTVKANSVLVRDYDYDGNGNRTHVNGLLLGSHDAQDRLLAYNGTTYAYTAAGDLATKTQGAQVTSYTYDAIGNLRQVTLPGGPSIEYVIDGQSRRVGKKVNGVLRQGFLYADQLRIAAELTYNASGVLIDTTRFVYGSKANVPDTVVKSGVTYRILSDHLGSPRLVVNAADSNPVTAVVQRIDYDEFGNVTQDTNPGFQPFGFAGGVYDQDTKLERFGARDYDAAVGRWTTKDPIGFAGGDANLFGYVVGDPVNRLDLTGTEGYVDRALDNFMATNTSLYGFLAPTGLGFILGAGPTFATELGSATFFQWYAAGFGSMTMGSATFTGLETGLIVGATHLVAAAFVGLAYEAGVVAGSLISALPLGCGPTVGDVVGGSLFDAYAAVQRSLDMTYHQ